MASVKTGSESTGLVARIRRWFHDVAAEMRRVVKPTPEETTQMMLVVIGFVLFVGIWFFLWDVILTLVTTRIETWTRSLGP